MAKRVFIFDLDDTLIDNVHDYAGPILDMARLIICVLGPRAPHVSKIISLEEELDLRRRGEINPDTGKVFGYSMERFPGTLVETYRAICCRANVDSVLDVEKQLYQIGAGAFNKDLYAKNIKPGAIDTINFIINEGDVCMLLTKGDKRVQVNKIAALGQASDLFWGGIKIVDEKTPEIFRRMVTKFSGCQWYSVGNDYDKDIAPAFEVKSFRGIWIPVETWETIDKMGEIRNRVDGTRCLELQSLTELKEKYGEL
ncbi:MAG: hypothetical protein HYT62_00540 [Candidatus Yanofskybacteria bacterium]|nr:hypothetical protein [Candidatus Yanofskybacteria bacterium]